MKRLYCLIVLALLCIHPASAAAPAVRELHALFAQEWERGLRENPEAASFYGDRRYNHQWTDLSLDAVARTLAGDQAALARLLKIPRAALPPTEQLNHDLFRRQLEQAIEGHRYRQFLLPVNQRNGVQTYDEITEYLPFQTQKDYEDWLQRLRGFDKPVNQTVALMRAGLAEKRTPPRVVMQRVPEQIARQLVPRPEDSPFYAPFKRMPDSIPAVERERLAAQARAAIADTVLPALRRFQTFFNTDYLPACRDSIAASNQPDGAAYYAWAARQFTTTALTPEQIHDIGLKEVARIRAGMDAVMQQAGFKGSLREFLDFLRTDTRFFYKSGSELLDGYLALSKRIDPELVKLFGKLPRLPYGVRAVPEANAPNQTTAYYLPGAADGTRAGYFYANTYQPESRPKWEMEALTLHEAVPGHHFQIALAQELGELPMFRRQATFTAFVEGWGLYAESLGGELGLYTDPYSKFGQLSYEMWRAIRLVVDTGMHAKGWTREQALDLFRANTGKTELDIANEVDRYISWPGQALAYKIGQLKIVELRRRAEQKLGNRFDIRAFHDRVLGRGAVPLDLLEQDIDAWIATHKAR